MILKEEIKKDGKIVWYLKNNTIYVIKINEKDFYILNKIKLTIPKRKKNKFLKFLKSQFYMFCFFLGIVTSLNKDFVMICLEEPSVIPVLFEWDNLNEEEKTQKLLEEIENLLENNKNVEEEEKEIILNGYNWYLPQYIEYMNKENAYQTFLASSKVNIETTEKKIYDMDDNYLIRTGFYDNKTIYYADTNAIFHEKIHADSHLDSNINVEEWAFGEIKAAFAEEKLNAYNDLRAIASLLGELLGTKFVARTITQNKGNLIWIALEEEYPEFQKEIEEMKSSFLKIAYIKYKEHKEPTKYIETFLENYQLLYQEKYNINPEEDKIVSFLKDILFSEITLKNRNVLEYNDKFKIDNIIIRNENRKGNYRDALIQIMLYQKDEVGIKFCQRWFYLQNLLEVSSIKTYQELNYYCSSFLEPKEIEEFTNHLLGISRVKDTEKNSYINDTFNYLLMRKLGVEKPFNLELFRTK